MTRLVLVGGGHAHALVLLKFREFISKNLHVTLVNPSPVHSYSGMVPGVVAGHYSAAGVATTAQQIRLNAATHSHSTALERAQAAHDAMMAELEQEHQQRMETMSARNGEK